MQKKENVLNKIKMCWNMCRVYIKCAGMSVEGRSNSCLNVFIDE